MSNAIRTNVYMTAKAVCDQRAAQNQRQGPLVKGDARYWSAETGRLACALAALEIVLLRSEEANTVYREVCAAWGKRGCRVLTEDFKAHTAEAKDWAAKFTKAKERGAPVPVLPSVGGALLSLEIGDADCQHLFERIAELILTGFNRESDSENLAWKVTGTPELILVIGLRSLVDYNHDRWEDWTKYRTFQVGERTYDTNSIMVRDGKPGPREERHLAKKLRQEFKKYGFAIRLDKTLLNGASVWYECRVSPGTIEACIDQFHKRREEFEKCADQHSECFRCPQEQECQHLWSREDPDRGNVETLIAPYDDVLGYPRRWHK